MGPVGVLPLDTRIVWYPEGRSERWERVAGGRLEEQAAVRSEGEGRSRSRGQEEVRRVLEGRGERRRAPGRGRGRGRAEGRGVSPASPAALDVLQNFVGYHVNRGGSVAACFWSSIPRGQQYLLLR